MNLRTKIKGALRAVGVFLVNDWRRYKRRLWESWTLPKYKLARRRWLKAFFLGAPVSVTGFFLWIYLASTPSFFAMMMGFGFKSAYVVMMLFFRGMELSVLLMPITYPLVRYCRWFQIKSDRHPAGACRSCGYDLTGLRGDICPECGGTQPRTKGETRHEPIRRKSGARRAKL